jgi:hypothetical protein
MVYAVKTAYPVVERKTGVSELRARLFPNSVLSPTASQTPTIRTGTHQACFARESGWKITMVACNLPDKIIYQERIDGHFGVKRR